MKKIQSDPEAAFLRAIFEVIPLLERHEVLWSQKIRKEVFALSDKFRNAKLNAKRWSDEPSSGRNPAEFIRQEYFLCYGLTPATLLRADVQRSDPELITAYAQWIRRHPEDCLWPGDGKKRPSMKGMSAKTVLAHKRALNAQNQQRARVRLKT